MKWTCKSKLFVLFATLYFSGLMMLQAQQSKENTLDLRKASQKGWLTNSERKEDGSIVMTYTI